jgi:hypothetical protein
MENEPEKNDPIARQVVSSVLVSAATVIGMELGREGADWVRGRYLKRKKRKIGRVGY